MRQDATPPQERDVLKSMVAHAAHLPEHACRTLCGVVCLRQQVISARTCSIRSGRPRFSTRSTTVCWLGTRTRVAYARHSQAEHPRESTACHAPKADTTHAL